LKTKFRSVLASGSPIRKKRMEKAGKSLENLPAVGSGASWHKLFFHPKDRERRKDPRSYPRRGDKKGFREQKGKCQPKAKKTAKKNKEVWGQRPNVKLGQKQGQT